MPYAYFVAAGIDPRSSTRTESGVRVVSSRAIVRPVQPPPTIATSTGLRRVGSLATFVFPWREPMPCDLLEAFRRRPPCLAEVRVNVRAIIHQRAGESYQLPSSQIRIAAVHRIAKHSFERVRAQEGEKRSLLDG